MSINPINSYDQIYASLNLAMKSFTNQQKNIMRVFQEFVQENAILAAQSSRKLELKREMQEKNLPLDPHNFFFLK